MTVTGGSLTGQPSKALTETKLANFITEWEKADTREEKIKLPADPEYKRA